MPSPLTPGKRRGIDTLTTDEGVFCVLAIDHRDSLRAVLADDVTDPEIVEFKLDLIRAVGARASGVMLEPEFTLPQAINAQAVSGQTGFIAALEAQGYMQDPWAGPTQFLDGWSAQQAKTMGASAAKLLLPFDFRKPSHAAAQLDVVKAVAETCDALDIALLVEPVAFGMDPADRPQVVLEGVGALTGLGIDILKVEFPGDPNDPAGWSDACAAVDAACEEPWVLLSSGVTFEQYRAQLDVAFTNGCSGFTGGRAIWRPATEVAAPERASALRDIVVPRFDELRALAVSHARAV